MAKLYQMISWGQTKIVYFFTKIFAAFSQKTQQLKFSLLIKKQNNLAKLTNLDCY